MILADKIIALRKQSGWSQEELADRMDVSRQAVSKWESAQSTPDLDKLLRLSQLFGVSTDYLLREELEAPEFTPDAPEAPAPAEARRVSMEEASDFLAVKLWTAGRIAFGVALCILSPIAVLILGVAAEQGRIALSEAAAVGLGLIVLLLLVAVAVAIFVICGMKTSRFAYLEKELIETAYGVTGMVRQRQEQFRSVYTRRNVAGVSLCILAVLPLFVGIMMQAGGFTFSVLIGALLAVAAAGAYCFVSAGVPWGSFQMLLEEGDYTRVRKQASHLTEGIATVYWLLVVAVYLGWSFTHDNWNESWIIWPVAGVVFAAVMAVCSLLPRKK